MLHLGMCVFKSSTEDVKTTTFRSLRQLCVVLLTYYLTLKAKDAKGVSLAMVSELMRFIFPHSTYHHMTL